MWEKGERTENADPDIWRKDECGAWIRRDFYAYRESRFGWDVALIVSKSNGGTDDVSNLRPLQWQNKELRDGGRRACAVTAAGWDNVRA